MREIIESSAEAKFVKNSVAARLNGVCTKTLDRWAEAGIIPKPRVINGYKYHAVDTLMAAGVKRG
jgi:predicted site-specific integrase-resolvase